MYFEIICMLLQSVAGTTDWQHNSRCSGPSGSTNFEYWQSLYLTDASSYESCLSNCPSPLVSTHEECKTWADGFLAWTDQVLYGSQICVTIYPQEEDDPELVNGLKCEIYYPRNGWYQGTLQPRVCTAWSNGVMPGENHQTLVFSQADAESSYVYADWFDGESCPEPVVEPEPEPEVPEEPEEEEPEPEVVPEEPGYESTCDFMDEAWSDNSDCWKDISTYGILFALIAGISLLTVVIVVIVLVV